MGATGLVTDYCSVERGGFRCLFSWTHEWMYVSSENFTWLGSPLPDESWSILWKFASAQLPAHLK